MNYTGTIKEGTIIIDVQARLYKYFEEGQHVELDIKRPDAPRSHPQNKLYWAMLKWMIANIREDVEKLIGRQSSKGMHEILKARQLLESTNFCSCDHDEFTHYVNYIKEHELTFFCGASYSDAKEYIKQEMR